MTLPNICFHERKDHHPVAETIADRDGTRHRIYIERCVDCFRTLERSFFVVPIWEGTKH